MRMGHAIVILVLSEVMPVGSGKRTLMHLNEARGSDGLVISKSYTVLTRFVLVINPSPLLSVQGRC